MSINKKKRYLIKKYLVNINKNNIKTITMIK